MTAARPLTRLRRRVAAAVCLVFAGCSFATVQRPQTPADPREPERCTTSPAAPIADSALAGVGLFSGLVFGPFFTDCARSRSTSPSGSTSAGGCGGDRGVQLAGLAAFAAGGVFLGSALHGHLSTARCRRQVSAGRRCADGDVRSCKKLNPAWPLPPGWRAPGAVLEPEAASPSPTAAAPVPVAETREQPVQQPVPEPAPAPGDAR